MCATNANIKLTLKNQLVLRKLMVISSSCAIPGNVVFNTRTIADACNIDIYSARYSLLKLTRIGLVRSVNNGKSLKWKLFTPSNEAVA